MDVKSEAEICTPSRIKRGDTPEFMEFIPLIRNDAVALGSPELEMTDSPGAFPCRAWSKLAAGTSFRISDLTVATDPAMVPFLRTP